MVLLSSSKKKKVVVTHVTTGEVAALEHEIRDDTVELGASVAEPLLARGQSAKVLDRLGDYIVKELEVDATLLSCGAGQQLCRWRCSESDPRNAKASIQAVHMQSSCACWG